MLCSSPGTMSSDMSNYMSGTRQDSGCGRMPNGLPLSSWSLQALHYKTMRDAALNPGRGAGHGGLGGLMEEVQPKLKSDG